jgi:hypothetical protein
MKTECNCDLPLFAYVDWLQEQGWEVTEEELEVYPIYGFYTGSGFWRSFGSPWDQICTSGDGYADDWYSLEYYRLMGNSRGESYVNCIGIYGYDSNCENLIPPE